ncbi:MULTISPECIES: hypothetical protein [unclassified Kaistella]|uniref:hypothetical protein n=1 Tax=unclassified Kaistella TaxID=2762626 RepID=UPI002733CFB2|nr:MULTISPECIES: hypothetical protein [unclassified Kaistella]MCZ2084199.1 hypothetical protein [Flavobacteriales bacterium]MDP2454076.1 hypothetical protein [Kaistella sp. SH11-4b]MDP2457133.1 hypothetical protein [Kaistella sp. SH40-3]MDP2459891.1 hypothetical protein [Kaistella sp. SH19-2b]
MKNKIIIFTLILFSASLFAQKNGLEINGWTNINTFKCSNPKFKNSSSVYSFTGSQLPNISVAVEDFDCRNKMMTADFRKVLQSDKYPYMTIKFLEFKKSTGNRFEAVVEVKMMTVAKKYNIEFSNYNNSLVGNKRLKFSDFKIVPPKKMGGMVYVKDELDLVFSLETKD